MPSPRGDDAVKVTTNATIFVFIESDGWTAQAYRFALDPSRIELGYLDELARGDW